MKLCVRLLAVLTVLAAVSTVMAQDTTTTTTGLDLSSLLGGAGTLVVLAILFFVFNLFTGGNLGLNPFKWFTGG